MGKFDEDGFITLTGRQARFAKIGGEMIPLERIEEELNSILGVVEAFRQAQIISSSTFNYTALVGAALLYLCVTIPLSRVLDRWGIGGRRV